jgi:hypothetical protein
LHQGETLGGIRLKIEMSWKSVQQIGRVSALLNDEEFVASSDSSKPPQSGKGAACDTS